MESSIENIKRDACQAVDSATSQLKEISSLLWSRPELAYEERYAHELITGFLKENGFSVKKHTPLDTSFIAKFGCKQGVKVGILCEYDALPGIGHGCGHNLIAEAGLAAGIALKHVIECNGDIAAEITVFGTPAEESGGGKIDMIRNGCFDDVDFCMMVHPYVRNVLMQKVLARSDFNVTFHGKASHASAAPWDGINALDAAVQFYNSISMMRQQLKPTLRIHGVIKNGGSRPNVIPDLTELEYYIRGENEEDVEQLEKRFRDMAAASAKATGCTCDVTLTGNPFSNMTYNTLLCDLFTQNSFHLGTVYPPESAEDSIDVGSTDMGNVSHVKPSIHVLYGIPANNPCHTIEFTAAAGAEEAQKPTLNAGKAMAMTALDVICNRQKLQCIMELFQEQHKSS